nr:site-specific integrase [Bacteroides intestinalis]
MAKLSLVVLSRKDADFKYPIFICVYSKQKRAYIKLPYQLENLAQWENGKVVSCKNMTMLNAKLKAALSKYKERLIEIENADAYSAMQLKQILTQKDNTPQSTATFTDYFRERIEDLKKEGRGNYAKMHEETLRIFLLSEGEVPFVIMNHITVEHFDTYMKRKGYSDGNRNIRLSHIKARVNEAIKYGLIKCEKHPFAYTKLPSSEPKDYDISIADFIKIVEANTGNSKRLTLAKDMFLLSFYIGGTNLADIVQIDFSQKEINYIRQKSGAHKRKDRITRITIQPEARYIIDKYIGKNGRLDLGYNYTYTNMCCYINSCLKLLAKELNIKSNLTFYSARKTFAQFASEIAIPYPIIEYCLGHSIKTNITINSYVKVKQSQADAAIKRVIEYTKQPKIFEDFINLRNQMQMMVI